MSERVRTSTRLIGYVVVFFVGLWLDQTRSRLVVRFAPPPAPILVDAKCNSVFWCGTGYSRLAEPFVLGKYVRQKAVEDRTAKGQSR